MRRAPILLGALLAAAVAGEAVAVDGVVEFSSDQTIECLGLIVSDDDVIRFDGANVTLVDLGTGIPVEADVDAYEPTPAGEHLFSLDVVAQVGGVVASPADVIRYDPGTLVYGIEFDAASNGIPAGVDVDAVALEPFSGQLVLSFDQTVDLGGGLVVADEDLVVFNGAAFAIYLAPMVAFGVDPGVDVDAAHLYGGLLPLVSVDQSANLAGTPVTDDTLALFVFGGWIPFVEPSAIDPGCAAGDVDAIGDPPPPRPARRGR